MKIVRNMHAAKTEFSQLVAQALAGNTVIVAKSGRPIVQLVPWREPSESVRTPGTGKGSFTHCEISGEGVLVSTAGQESHRSTVGPLILIGASGYGRELLWVCGRAGIEVAGFCDDAPDKQTGEFAGQPLLGSIEQAAAERGTCVFHVAVGDNRARQRLAARAVACGWSPAAVIDPSALLAPDAVVEPGAYVGIGSVVSCLARVAPFAIINHHVTVGHEAVIGAFAQLCPGVRVSGGCVLGEGALLGSNAAILPGKRMGTWSVLGAGAVGVSDLADGAHVVRVR